MELEESSIEFKPVADRRPLLPEPPPVRLVSIEDVHLPAAAGRENELDAFYGGLLLFEREGRDSGHLHYKADNFRLMFDVLEPPIAREDMRPVGIEIRSLSEMRQQLTDGEIEFEYHRGLMAGTECILLQDPAGNWVSLTQVSKLR